MVLSDHARGHSWAPIACMTPLLSTTPATERCGPQWLSRDTSDALRTMLQCNIFYIKLFSFRRCGEAKTQVHTQHRKGATWVRDFIPV